MTLAKLRALIRLTLADTDRWPDETLNEWIAAAMWLYGAHFGERVTPLSDADPIDVPLTHLEALIAYVDYCASREMQVKAATTSDGSSITVGQLGDMARRAWNRYKDVMNQLVALAVGGADPVSWADYGL